MCVAYHVESIYLRTYALWSNDRFQGFVEPPPREVSLVDYKGTKLEVEVPLDVSKQIASVLAAERLDGNEVVRRAVLTLRGRKETASPFSRDVVALLKSRTDGLLSQYQTRDEMQRKFDGAQFHLGASQIEIRRRLGDPDGSGQVGEMTVETWTIATPRDINPIFRLSGIAVEYSAGAAVATYGGDFFLGKQSELYMPAKEPSVAK